MTGAILAIIFGLGFMGLGYATLSEYRNVGSAIVENFVPKWARIGDTDTHRKVLAFSYIGGGILFFAVGMFAIAR
jgi:hypothetical protein